MTHPGDERAGRVARPGAAAGRRRRLGLAPGFCLLAIVLSILACGDGESHTPVSAFALDRPEGTRLRGARLWAALPDRADLRREGDAVFWRSGARRLRVLEGVAGGDLWLELDASQVLRVSGSLLRAPLVEPLAALEPMRARAAEAGFPLTGLRLEFVPILGAPALVNAQAYVLPDAVLHRSPLPAAERRAAAHGRARARQRLRAALARTRAELQSAEPDPTTARALVQLLERASAHEPSVDPPPRVARRLLRHGWLERSLPGLASAPELRLAFQELARPWPVSRRRGAQWQIETLESASEENLRWLRTPDSVRYARALPSPSYVPAPELTGVVELAPGATPERPGAWRRASVYWGELELASAGADGSFRFDAELWERLRAGPGAHGAQLPGAFPPHVLVASPLGDPLALVTEHGALHPPRGSDDAAAETFLDEAARALPDAGHLDLIGERLHAYVYDSPDPRRPQLIGSAGISVDIHQSARQSLERSLGGTLYGDCDDLSELYLEIATRQGRNAHMLGLPGHAALAWTEPTREDRWRTVLLQTGPPLAFDAPTPGASLRDAVAALAGPGASHGDQVEILLRFDGENTRDAYFLSQRVFTDAEFAQSMTELQRDWHRWTLLRGMRALDRRISAGDDSAESAIERAAFAASTGQHERAVRDYERALALRDAPAQRVYLRTELAMNYYELGENERGRAQAQKILEEELAGALEADAEAWLEPLAVLAGVLARPGRDPELALEILARHAKPILDRRGLWYRDGAEQLQLERFMRSAIGVVSEASRADLRGGPHWREVTALIRSWFEQCAFRRSEPARSPLSSYALLGRFYRALRPEIGEAIRLAEPARDGRDHARRAGAPLGEDLRWIRVAPQYWWQQLREELDAGPDVTAPELAEKREGWLQMLRLAHTAREAASELGLDHPRLAQLDLLGEALGALLRGRVPELAAALDQIHRSGDRARTQQAADWLAWTGVHLPLEEFGRAIDVALNALPTAQLYMRIAWRCAREDAPAHARLAARKAAEHFADVPAFGEEYRLILDPGLPAFEASSPRARSAPPPSDAREATESVS